MACAQRPARVAQALGALGGAALGAYVLPHTISFPAVAPGAAIGRGFGAELLATFFLASVILQVATAPATRGNR